MLDTDGVKCVVWDLDGTLWDGVAVERADSGLPEVRPEMLAAVDALAGRGVLSSIASRSAPEVLERLTRDTGLAARFLAPQVSWQDKSTALRRIAAELGVAVESLLLVDDSPYERAEVEALLPGVRTADPRDVPALLASFDGRPVTAEARARVDRYRTEEVRRRAGERFEGSREEFLRWCEMRIEIGAAGREEIPRALELAERTHRLNSSGLDREQVRLMNEQGGHRLFTARMTDRFGDYGIIGMALVRPGPTAWSVPLLALSCRIAGRGASVAFLRWLMEEARTAGADEFTTDLRPTGANTELRLLFRQAGLRIAGEGGDPAQSTVTLTRTLHGDLPSWPGWLQVCPLPIGPTP
ncbi:HAD-IIIC family phosphatase [Streptomyces actinomycinicus]|uniref:HAD-IIIC family phosphatase n=1 Tax=Streptomyces actinomycinicus TaxID=1695166 RepID=A0A937EHD5_9ACTN|nr:HAD-IIIC family phosphatase [Streptomyces actinomycinicus]MBL1083122.1 HAD-IIIC family phosphatase [Streptomyces actinomycinicus]